MFKDAWNWICSWFDLAKKSFGPTVITSSQTRPMPLPTVRAPGQISDLPITCWLKDPTTPDLKEAVSSPAAPLLNLHIDNYQGGVRELETPAGQAAMCYVWLSDSINYVISKADKKPTNWAAVSSLRVIPRAGQDFNAYYDRTNLKFFEDIDPASGKMVYATDASDVVCHELGHALLDATRPEFWATQSLEIMSFHEAFGDCNAMIAIMRHPEVLACALKETDGNMHKTNVISQLAQQLGTAIYQNNNAGLRNAVNTFTYVPPMSLPDQAPDDQLAREPHSFSRVFTGAWYDMMAGIFDQLIGADIDRLKRASEIAAQYLLFAISRAPNTPHIYNAIAQSMLVADHNLNNGQFAQVIKDVFSRRQILQPQQSFAPQDYTEFSKKLSGNDHVKYTPHGIHVYRKNHKFVKLTDYGRKINPLYDLEIEIAADSTFRFDPQGKMLSMFATKEPEAIAAAKVSLNFLHAQKLVGDDWKQPFMVQNGRLLRRHFACGDIVTENSNNPEAPEYQKPWKAANNAGCNCCSAMVESIAQTHVKLGCYVNSSGNGYVVSNSGSRTSSQVC